MGSGLTVEEEEGLSMEGAGAAGGAVNSIMLLKRALRSEGLDMVNHGCV